MKKQYWLINPRSGGREGARIAEVLRDQVTVVTLDFSRLHEQIAGAADHDHIVVAGGDGTVASVLTSPALPDRPVALVSLGTANDLAREIGTFRLFHGKRWEELPTIIRDLPEQRLSTWEAEFDGERRTFCNYISLGFEGAVVSDFDRWRSNSSVYNRLLNRLMYLVFGMRHLGARIEGAQIARDSGEVQAVSPTRGIIISNIKSHMGCGFTTLESDCSDSFIECVRVSSPLDYLRMLACPFGFLPSLGSMHRGSCIELSNLPRPTALQIDGEPSVPIEGGQLRVTCGRIVRVLGAVSCA
jgi:hypothetical protein